MPDQPLLRYNQLVYKPTDSVCFKGLDTVRVRRQSEGKSTDEGEPKWPDELTVQAAAFFERIGVRRLPYMGRQVG